MPVDETGVPFTATRVQTLNPYSETLMMSGLDGSGAVHTVLPWEAFGGHVPSGGLEMYWFDQSIPIHLFKKIHASGTLEMPPLDADASQWASSFNLAPPEATSDQLLNQYY